MKEFGLLALTLPIIFLSSACNIRPDASVQRAALLRAEHDSVNIRNSRDAERMLALFADDAMLIPPGLPVVMGKTAIGERVRLLAQRKGVLLTYQNLKAEVSRDELLGYTVSNYEITSTRPNGSPEVSTGRWVRGWRSQEGEWKLSVEIWNSSEPVTEATR